MKLIGEAKLVNAKAGGPVDPTAALWICLFVGDAILCVTTIVNIIVVVLNASVAKPVAV